MITKERKAQIDAATARAMKVLKPGDRIRVHRCGGIVSTCIFDHWDGDCIVTRSGICDIAAIHIDRLNGREFSFDARG